MIVETINKAWAWLNIVAHKIVDENQFGNIIFIASDGSFWRITPENPDCVCIANTADEFDDLKKDSEFQVDWEMENLVDAARDSLGELKEGEKYCLKIPSYVGGEYSLDNLGIISQIEQIGVSGSIAKQIHNLPDGATIELSIE